MNETRYRKLALIINSIATISVIITAIALYYNVKEINKKEVGADIFRWQESVIYNTICENPKITFKELHSKYIEAATKYGLDNLPQKSLQDVELNKILLSLMSGNIIEKDSKNNYRAINRTDREETYKDWLEESKNINQRFFVKARILLLVEKESGTHTMDSLYLKLKENIHDIDYGTMTALVGELRNSYLVYKTPDGILKQTSAYRYELGDKRNIMRSRILSLIEQGSESYTMESLYQKLKEQDAEADFDIMVDLIGELRYKQLVYKSKRGVLYATYGFRGEYK